MSDVDLLRTLAPVVALLGAMLHLAAPKAVLGAEARYWNRARRALLPKLDALKSDHTDDGYAAYRLDEAEHVGTVDAPIGAVEEQLADAGLSRMPLAALKKTPDGRVERGSWAGRSAIFARDQIHVMLFEGENGGTDVYAHHERNAYNPLTAYAHYRGVGYDPERGVREARTLLDIDS